MLRVGMLLALLGSAGCGALLDFDPADPDLGIGTDQGVADGGGPRDLGTTDLGMRDAQTDAGCTTQAECDDHVFCNGPEQCVSGTCLPGTPPPCANHGCGVGFCSSATNACGLMPNPGLCAMGFLCNGMGNCVTTTTCTFDSDCMVGRPPCTDARCAGGTCAYPPHSCPADVLGCARIMCDPTVDACIGGADVSLCPDDGIACTVTTCSVDPTTLFGACSYPPTPDPSTVCDDRLACTVDLCMPSACPGDTSGCIHVPSDSACTPWLTAIALPIAVAACTTPVCAPGVMGSDTASGCMLTPICGPMFTCNGASGTGVCSLPAPRPCSTSAECDDRDPCNGTETCLLSGGPGMCVPGTAFTCATGCAFAPPATATPPPVCLPMPSACAT